MAETNSNSRLEAFCDGVFAIALTLLIIDIKIPSTVEINNASELWLAIRHVSPSIFAFTLSFIVILITWVNHHNSIRLINKSSATFIYANGFLLFTVVFVPFPTSLIGEYISTDHAAPAVILYNSVLALQAIGWILICRIAVKDHLCKNEKAAVKIRENGKFGYFAFMLYSVCAVIAFWFPITIAAITTLTWIFWLIYGMSLKHEEAN